MNVSGPIKTLIAANVAAHAIFAGRIYPSVLEQETAYPAAAINTGSVRPHNSKTNASTLDRVSVQIDIYGTTYATTAAAAAALRTAIDYTSSGSLGHIEFEGQADMFSAKPELFRIMQTYSVGYTR
jgi:hypothetical protein